LLLHQFTFNVFKSVSILSFALYSSIGAADLYSLNDDQLSNIAGRDSVGFIKHEYSLNADVEIDMEALGEQFIITQYSLEHSDGGGANIGSGDDPIRYETGVALVQDSTGLLSEVEYMEYVSKPASSDALDQQVSFELGMLLPTLKIQELQYGDSYQRHYSIPEKGYVTNSKQEFSADEISLTLDDQSLSGIILSDVSMTRYKGDQTYQPVYHQSIEDENGNLTLVKITSPVSDQNVVLPESSFSASDLAVNGESLGGVSIDGAVTYYQSEHWNSSFMLDNDTALYFNVSSEQTMQDNGEVYNTTRLTLGKTKSFVKKVDALSLGNDLEIENLEFGSIDANTGEMVPISCVVVLSHSLCCLPSRK